MKRFTLLLSLTILLAQTQVYAAAPAKKPAQKPAAQTNSTAVRTNNNQAYPTSGDDFLLKYNVDDLEAAPWLNGGKRIYNNGNKK